jgi:hypothetical protein
LFGAEICSSDPVFHLFKPEFTLFLLQTRRFQLQNSTFSTSTYLFQFYDAQHCRTSATPCDICAEQTHNGGSTFKAYDFTAEAVIVLQSMLKMKDTTLTNVADLYRGVTNKKKNARKTSAESRLPFFNRGEGCCEDDANRFVRRLLIEGGFWCYVLCSFKSRCGFLCGRS